MPDTKIQPEGITDDTVRGPHPRLSAVAIERAKTRLGAQDNDGLAAALGYSNSMALWRARVGKSPIRLAHARRIARTLKLPLDVVFEEGTDA
jgi:hypothetical protein